MTEQAQAFVDSLNIDYKATFVPQSQSRNKGEKPCLNWRVTVGPVTTDYMQGIGHMPGYKFNQRRTLEVVEREQAASERGKYFPAAANWRGGFEYGGKPLPAPKLIDVLYSLVMDAGALDYDCFEDWASDYGYDPDSRAAEKIYNDCMAIALKLRRVIDLDAAREAFQDY